MNINEAIEVLDKAFSKAENEVKESHTDKIFENLRSNLDLLDLALKRIQLNAEKIEKIIKENNGRAF